MNINRYLSMVYDTFSHSSIDGLQRKSQEIVNIRLFGEPILNTTTGNTLVAFDYITPAIARALQVQLTRRTVRDFLLAQSSYALDVRPTRRTQYRWTGVNDRHVKWQMDLVDVRKMMFGPNVQYLFTIIDVFSKYAFVFPLANKQAKSVAVILDELFSSSYVEPGIDPFKPKLILSDRGSEFINHDVAFVCKFHKVGQIFSLPYTPLGIIERFNQTIKRKIRKAIQKRRFVLDTNNSIVIQGLVNDYNQTVHSTIQQRPMVVHFATDPHYTPLILNKVRASFRKVRDKARQQTVQVFRPGDVVRVLVWKDPRKSPIELQNIKKKFTYKKFAMSYWTKQHFAVATLRGINYTLRNYPRRLFHSTDLQRVHIL